jgi:predicted DNA-binding protein with PD1-like motif
MEDGTTRGGHVLGGHVSPLLEVWVTVDSTPLLKKHDEKTGLNLMDPDAKP